MGARHAGGGPMCDEWSDEELMARLADYLAAGDCVPPDLIGSAKAAFVWHDMDPDLADAAFDGCVPGSSSDFRLATPVWDSGMVELALDAGLARLTFDSALADQGASVTRASAASRALTLIAAELTIELEISKNVLYGQLIPAQSGDVRLCTPSGETTTSRIDDVGHFVLWGTPAEPFRLRCRTRSGTRVTTTWICP